MSEFVGCQFSGTMRRQMLRVMNAPSRLLECGVDRAEKLRQAGKQAKPDFTRTNVGVCRQRGMLVGSLVNSWWPTRAGDSHAPALPA
jgi:hypothetical protein